MDKAAIAIFFLLLALGISLLANHRINLMNPANPIYDSLENTSAILTCDYHSDCQSEHEVACCPSYDSRF